MVASGAPTAAAAISAHACRRRIGFERSRALRKPARNGLLLAVWAAAEESASLQRRICLTGRLTGPPQSLMRPPGNTIRGYAPDTGCAGLRHRLGWRAATLPRRYPRGLQPGPRR